jgi:hypothetical protein
LDARLWENPREQNEDAKATPRAPVSAGACTPERAAGTIATWHRDSPRRLS